MAGKVESDMLDSAEAADASPLDAMIRTSQFGVYLESAAFVTGETLHVDGGAHAGHW
jgi:hypothetical protein